MKFNVKNYICESFKELLKNGNLLKGIIVALFPAIAMIIFINQNPKSDFYIKHVSNFYCMLGLLTAVMTTLYLINRDFTSNAIFLINNSKNNRKAYVCANLIISFIIAIIYASIGVVLCLIAKQIGVPGELKSSFLCGFCANLILLIPTYFLLCYGLLLVGAKSGIIYAVLTGALLFLPNILSNILLCVHNEIIKDIIENIPLYYYPIYAGSNPLLAKQYIIGGILFIGILAFVMKKSESYE